jgi:quinol monooxygenase YgiN
MAYVLIVRMKAQEGNVERALEVLSELADASRGEPGCEAYEPCQSVEDPSSFALYERYRDQDAFEEHGQTEHFQRLAVGQLFPLMESPRERVFYTTVD